MRRAHQFEPESSELFDGPSTPSSSKTIAPRSASRCYRAALDYRDDPKSAPPRCTPSPSLERAALADPDRAIDTYRAVLEVDDQDSRALDELTVLYRERERFQDLAELYERRAEAAPSPPAAPDSASAWRASSRVSSAMSSAAIDQYEHIVQGTPDHADAIADLEALSQINEHKARVVEILRPLYERADDWRHLIALNQQRLELAQDRGEKIPILRENADLWETRGKDEQQALSALRAAFELDPDDGETRAELERLAEKTNSWDALAAAYEHGIETADPLVKRELLSSLATLHDQRRDDPRRALEAYERLFLLDETDEEPLEPMDMLATLLSDWETIVEDPGPQGRSHARRREPRIFAQARRRDQARHARRHARRHGRLRARARARIPRAPSPSTRSSSSTSVATTIASWSSSTGAASS